MGVTEMHLIIEAWEQLAEAVGNVEATDLFLYGVVSDLGEQVLEQLRGELKAAGAAP